MSKLRFIPTIDISEGKAVLVKQGKVYKVIGDPIENAKLLGITSEFQVVDLDRAMNKSDNKAIIKEIAQNHTCYVAGGIRTYEDALEMLNSSAKRVVISTAASDELLSRIPKKRLILAYDVDEKFNIFTNGRKDMLAETNLFAMIDKYAKYTEFLSITFHQTEGMETGLPINQVKEISKYLEKYNIQLIVAGGINEIEQVKELISIGVSPQLGSALWLNKFTLGELYSVFLNEVKQSKWCLNLNEEPMYPCAIRNTTGELLGLVYVTKETVKQTVDTRIATFYSRDNNKVWVKGETSGHTHTVHNVNFNCDYTAIQMIVDGDLFCHNGTKSCFRFRDPAFSGLLHIEEHLQAVLAENNANSYTSKIFKSEQMIYTKMLEEAHELWCAGTKKNITHEAADLLYFVVLDLIKHGVQVKDVLNELTKRRFKIVEEHKIEKVNSKLVQKEIKIGICIGKHNNYILEFFEKMGIVTKQDTSLGPRSLKYISHLKNGKQIPVKTVVVKPKDVSMLMQNGYIDAVVSFKDIIDNYPVDVKEYETEISRMMKTTKIVVLGRQDFDFKNYKNKKLVILSEYVYITNKWIEEKDIVAKVLPVSGSAEGYLVNELCDLCVVVCDTGTTIRENNLKIVDTLAESRIGFYINPTKYDYVAESIKV